MNLVINYVRDLTSVTRQNWNRFWFTPQDPATLSLIRVLAGGMLFYTHLVWTIGLEDFFGEGGWLSPAAVQSVRTSGAGWSLWWLVNNSVGMWSLHIGALVVFASLTLGLFTRPMSVLAWILTISYCQRVPSALYGLDQLNGYLSMYLMVGPSGARYSIDSWWARRSNPNSAIASLVKPSTGANIALRLMQLHLCVVYFFAGISKLQGPAWWDGTAMWGAVANMEYQTFDVTWLAAHPRVLNFLTHATIVWEIFYCSTVWNRWTRPLTLFIAVPLHAGIAIGFGMITFGTIMIVANMAFIPAAVIRRVLEGRTLALETASEETSNRVVPAPKMLQQFPKRARREPLR